MRRLRPLALAYVALAASFLLVSAAEGGQTFERADRALESVGLCTHAHCWAGYVQCLAENAEPGALEKCDAIFARCLDGCSGGSRLAEDGPTGGPHRPCFVALPTGRAAEITYINAFLVSEYRAAEGGESVRVWFGGSTRGRTFKISFARFDAMLANACNGPAGVVDTVRDAVALHVDDPAVVEAVAEAIAEAVTAFDGSSPPEPLPWVADEQGMLGDVVLDGTRWAARHWGDAEQVAAVVEAVLERLVGEETTAEERAELAGIVGQTVELAFRRLGWRL